MTYSRALQVAVVVAAVMLGSLRVLPLARAEDAPVDTALVVSVDISNSVDQVRYRLQIEGIAKALEDKSVLDAILNGPNGAILFSMVSWADQPTTSIPWVRITNAAEAAAVAARVRRLPQVGGEFTCMTRMLRSLNDKVVPQIPASATRTIIDVSGDGPENCNPGESIDTVRDELVASGVTINGLPILTAETADQSAPSNKLAPVVPPARGAADAHPLEDWYRQHVQGGNGSFVLPANGFGDFGRAIRQKFVIEISGTTRLGPPRHALAD